MSMMGKPDPEEESLGWLLLAREISDHFCRNIRREPEEVINYALMRIVQRSGAQSGEIWFYDEVSDRLVHKSGYNIERDYCDAPPSFRPGEGVIGRAFETWEVEEIAVENGGDPCLSARDGVGQGSYTLMAAPLVATGLNRGVLSTCYSHPVGFDSGYKESYGRIAELLAGFFSLYFSQHRLEEICIRITKQYLALKEECNMPDRKHLKRVSALAGLLARRLELPSDAVRAVSEMACLDDIGEIAIRTALLHKPGWVTEGEWMVLKDPPPYRTQSRPHLKADFVKSFFTHLRDSYTGVWQTRADAREKIPLAIMAQIIAIADSYDRMVSNAPPGETLTPEQAGNELEKKSGHLYDEEVVEAFLDVLNGPAAAVDQ